MKEKCSESSSIDGFGDSRVKRKRRTAAWQLAKVEAQAERRGKTNTCPEQDE